MPPFEYEALVGHLYVVGGRSISAPPSGALVEVAPLKAARGRETDTFFALVLPSGDAVAPATFYEQMAHLSAERYFDSGGSVTAAMRAVFAHLNENLLEHNRTTRTRTYEANIVCAVLRGSDLIVGRVGSGIILLMTGEQLETLPADLTNDEALYGAPLGVQSTADVKLTRHKIAVGSRLVLSDANLAEFPTHQIRDALRQQDVGAVLVAFKELAKLQLTLLAIEFVPPEAPVALPVSVPEGESTSAVMDAQRAQSSRKRAKEAEAQSQKTRRGLGRTGAVIAKQTQISAGAAAGRLASTLSVVNKTIEHYFGAPPDGKRPWFTLPVATGSAVLLPVVIVMIVVGLWLSGTGESQFEICIQSTNDVVLVARDVPSSNPVGTVTAWNAVIAQAQECQRLRPGDLSSAAVIREGQGIIDQINQVSRREATALYSLSGQIRRVILKGEDMYLLAEVEEGQRVYHTRLENGTLARTPTPIPDMSTGATVDDFPVGIIIDIAFSEFDNAIYALSANGTLVRCERRLTQDCSAQTLRGSESWVTPVAMQIWIREGRMYILDPGANQIWRYLREGGSYSNTPSGYFEGQNRTNINEAVDFGIDSPPTGNVFILSSDGSLRSYNSGELDPNFLVTDFPVGQEIRSAQSMYLDTNPVDQAIYITDRNTRTIYKVTLGGMRRGIYRVFDDEPFSALSGVATDGASTLFAVAGNTLFSLQE